MRRLKRPLTDDESSFVFAVEAALSHKVGRRNKRDFLIGIYDDLLNNPSYVELITNEDIVSLHKISGRKSIKKLIEVELWGRSL